MIYSTFGQLNALISTALVAVVAVFVISLIKIVFVYLKTNLFFKNIHKFCYTLIYGLLFIVVTNIFNFGEFNFGLLACFLLVVIALNKIVLKTVDFFSLKVYYIYIKLIKWEKYKIAKKFGSIKD